MPATGPLTFFIAGSWSMPTISRRARGDTLRSSSVSGAPSTSSGGTTIITTRCCGAVHPQHVVVRASGACTASENSSRPARNDSVRASGQRLPRGDGRIAAAHVEDGERRLDHAPTSESIRHPPADAWAMDQHGQRSSRVRVIDRQRASGGIRSVNATPPRLTSDSLLLTSARWGQPSRTMRLRGGDDGGGRRHERALEVRVERHRDGRRADAADRHAQDVVELLARPRGDLGAGAEVLDGLVDDEQPAGALGRAQDRLHVERDERAQVDDLERGRGLLGRLQALAQHLAPGDDGDVVAGARDARLAERQRILAGLRPSSRRGGGSRRTRRGSGPRPPRRAGRGRR